MPITNTRAAHMLGVARRAAHLAPIFGLDPQVMWLAGWLHDIGYESADDPADHPAVGADFVWPVIDDSSPNGIRLLEAIEMHGDPDRPQLAHVLCLNIADMTTSPNGEPMAASERLADIIDRYGATSKQYADAARLDKKLRDACAELDIPAIVFGGASIPGGWYPGEFIENTKDNE